MSNARGHRPQSAKGTASQPEEPNTLPGSDPDRERKQASAQINRTLKAWRKASGDAGAATPKTSKPDEPAEKEADAVADGVADALHGEGEDKAAEPGKEAAPKIGAKLEPGTIPLAREDEKNERSTGPKMPPKTLPAFPGAARATSKTPVQGGGKLRPRWKDGDFIYEWDYQHGTVEKYNKRGVHLGEFDPNTGAQTKPADKTRRIEP